MTPDCNPHSNFPIAVSTPTTGEAAGASRPVDAKAFTIGVLAVTACVLFVGLLLVTMQPRSALAIGQSDRGGDYVMLTSQLSNAVEGLIIIDAASKRMCLYTLDSGTKQIKLLQNNIPLDQLPGAREERENRGGRRGP